MGLEYIHIKHKPQIFHRNLKPSNILLYEDLEARIVDFKFIEAILERHTHICPSNLVRIIGSVDPKCNKIMKLLLEKLG